MKYPLTSLILILFVSCSMDNNTPAPQEPIDYTAQNEKEITDFIALNSLIAEKSSTGLYYVIDEPGTGEQPTGTSNVTVAYKGYFTNGSVFDQSDANGISFNLNHVIQGWTEGIAYFKEGGSGLLLIPSHLGYGSFNYQGIIPGGSVLIFEVNLISIN